MKTFTRLVDLALLCLLGALGFLLMTPRAQAQVTEPPPGCDPFLTGRGAVVAQVGAVVGAQWWCPPADNFGDWVPARAAQVLPAGAAVPDLRARSLAELVAGRTLPTTAPEFAPLWAALALPAAQSRPPARWQVAALDAGQRQAYRVTDAGTMSDMVGFFIATGTPCDCRVRISAGSTHYCKASFSDRIVAMCARSQ